jgi:hypothetical protein
MGSFKPKASTSKAKIQVCAPGVSWAWAKSA